MNDPRILQGDPRKRVILTAATILACAAGAAGCVAAPDSDAGPGENREESVGEAPEEYVASGPIWTNKAFTMKANLTSFQNNLGALNLTSDQAEFWINFALSNWKERTGADLSLGYAGTTASTCLVQNGENGVAAQTACAEPGCTTWAQTVWWYNGSSMVEADVCVYGNSATWRVDSQSFPAGNKDVVGVLAHEFGHALGLNHTPNTVMDSPTFNTGNTLARYPYGDDATGIRALYGTKTRNLQWSTFDGTSWSGTTVLTSGMQMHANGAIGVNASGAQTLVAAHLDPSTNYMHFTRSAVPLSAGSVWDNRFIGATSFRPPAVAAKDSGAALWVAAWANATTTLGCSGIGFMASGDVFDSAWLSNLPGDCTIHEPALVFDPISGRFVMMYVTQQSGVNQANNGRIYARTSTDGVNWTAIQDLGIYTIDAPHMACAANGQCMLTYPGGGADPWLMTTQFTVNAGTGQISLGGSGWNYNRVQRTPPVGVNEQWVWTGASWILKYNFVVGLQWSGNPSDRANGAGGIWTTLSNSTPVTAFGWTGTGLSAEHRADIVGGQYLGYPIYALTTAN